MINKKHSKKTIYKFLITSMIFCFLTAIFILPNLDFNIQLIFMILLIFLTYYMVIEFMMAGLILVCLIYFSGFISVAIITKFTEYHTNAVMAFQLSIVISVIYLYIYVKKVDTSQKKLYSNSVIDDVTGIYNKRYYNIKINEEFEIAKEQNQNFALMLIDLDRFKLINDTHGHLFGDEILRSFASLVKSKIRVNDIFCRFGGDEFVLLISDYNEKNFEIISTRIAEAISCLNKRYDKELNGAFTASIGLSVFPEDTSCLDEMLNCADQAMYKAKLHNETQFVKYSSINSA